MQTVQLTDQLRRRAFTLTGAESFDDVDAALLTGIIAAKRRYQDEFLQARAISALVFGINDDQLGRLTPYQLLQLTTTVEFTFEPVVKMEKWLFSSLPALKLYGPADELENITFEELMHADQRLDQYKHTGDEIALSELVAVLMRPRRWFRRNGADIREAFNQHTITRRAERIRKRLDLDTQLAIHFNYVACRSRMTDYFKNLFPDPDPDAVPGDKPATNDNWLDVAIDLASKDPVLGKLHDIEKDNVYLVLKVLDRVIRQNNEMKEYYESLK